MGSIKIFLSRKNRKGKSHHMLNKNSIKTHLAQMLILNYFSFINITTFRFFPPATYHSFHGQIGDTVILNNLCSP